MGHSSNTDTGKQCPDVLLSGNDPGTLAREIKKPDENTCKLLSLFLVSEIEAECVAAACQGGEVICLAINGLMMGQARSGQDRCLDLLGQRSTCVWINGLHSDAPPFALKRYYCHQPSFPFCLFEPSSSCLPLPTWRGAGMNRADSGTGGQPTPQNINAHGAGSIPYNPHGHTRHTPRALTKCHEVQPDASLPQ